MSKKAGGCRSPAPKSTRAHFQHRATREPAQQNLRIKTSTIASAPDLHPHRLQMSPPWPATYAHYSQFAGESDQNPYYVQQYSRIQI